MIVFSPLIYEYSEHASYIDNNYIVIGHKGSQSIIQQVRHLFWNVWLTTNVRPIPTWECCLSEKSK